MISSPKGVEHTIASVAADYFARGAHCIALCLARRKRTELNKIEEMRHSSQGKNNTPWTKRKAILFQETIRVEPRRTCRYKCAIYWTWRWGIPSQNISKRLFLVYIRRIVNIGWLCFAQYICVLNIIKKGKHQYSDVIFIFRENGSLRHVGAERKNVMKSKQN